MLHCGLAAPPQKPHKSWNLQGRDPGWAKCPGMEEREVHGALSSLQTRDSGVVVGPSAGLSGWGSGQPPSGKHHPSERRQPSAHAVRGEETRARKSHVCCSGPGAGEEQRLSCWLVLPGTHCSRPQQPSLPRTRCCITEVLAASLTLHTVPPSCTCSPESSHLPYVACLLQWHL